MGHLCALLCAGAALAQMSHVAVDAHRWPAGAPGDRSAQLAKIEPGWHLYSASSPAGIPTIVSRSPAPDAYPRLSAAAQTAFDPNFDAEAETFEGEVTFLARSDAHENARRRWMSMFAIRPATTNSACRAPVRSRRPLIRGTCAHLPAGYTEARPPGATRRAASSARAQGLGGFLLVAFGFGLAAIFTPCVFPMIPITVSFFLTASAAAATAFNRPSFFASASSCCSPAWVS